MSLRIAFTLIGGRNWTGGYNYLLNLLRVLSEHAPGEVHALLLAGTDVGDEELGPFLTIPDCEVHRTPLMNESQRTALQLRCLVLGADPGIQEILRHHRIDLVFESALFLGWRLRVPAIAWIPDLQHRFLPHLFSRSAWLKRELGFRAQVASGRFIMVSSEDTRSHLERLYPRAAGRVRAVRFAVKPGRAASAHELQTVREHYGLPDRFFFMPNQFWAHKNHLLVIQALELLFTQGECPIVVASGKQLDPRSPGHFDSVRRRVHASALETHFRMPGLVPYEHVHTLMQAATALVNPSLFEGWSTTVEEARANGVPMLLSELAVHREQAGDEAFYFGLADAAGLASALRRFDPERLGSREERRERAAGEAVKRMQKFAQEFLLVARSAFV